MTGHPCCAGCLEDECILCTVGDTTCTSCSMQVVLAGFADDPGDCTADCDFFNDTFIVVRPGICGCGGSGCEWAYVLTGAPDCPNAPNKANCIVLRMDGDGIVTVEICGFSGTLARFQKDFGGENDVLCNDWVNEDLPFSFSSIGCDDFSGNMTCEITSL